MIGDGLGRTGLLDALQGEAVDLVEQAPGVVERVAAVRVGRERHRGTDLGARRGQHGDVVSGFDLAFDPSVAGRDVGRDGAAQRVEVVDQAHGDARVDGRAAGAEPRGQRDPLGPQAGIEQGTFERGARRGVTAHVVEARAGEGAGEEVIAQSEPRIVDRLAVVRGGGLRGALAPADAGGSANPDEKRFLHRGRDLRGPKGRDQR